MLEDHERVRDENILHRRIEWFFEKHAPKDKYDSAEFHADLVMVIQAVHENANRQTQALLRNSLNGFGILGTFPRDSGLLKK